MEKIEISRRGRVGEIFLNDPDNLNRLSQVRLRRLFEALSEFDQEKGIGCILIRGNQKAFSAGGDIKEMSNKSAPEAFADDLFQFGQGILQIRKPIVAAVSGYALGGGCELAMACDIIVAARSARFGQPEIKLGIIPGMGGTQRMAKAIGKHKTMDVCLTGRLLTAEEAERADLVSRVVPDEELDRVALEVATEVAGMSLQASMMAKETINAAFETGLTQGLLFERRSFHSLFATENQKEGMAAFIEKRAAKFKF